MTERSVANIPHMFTGMEITEVCADLKTFVPGRPLDDDGSGQVDRLPADLLEALVELAAIHGPGHKRADIQH